VKFASIERLVSRAVDNLYGEIVRVDPRADGRFVHAAADPDRASFTTTAIVDLDPIIATPRQNDGASASLSGARVHVSFATSSLPVDLRSGDRIVALERGERAFIINVVEPDGIGRVLCGCIEGGGAA
jgi:hypothetical protein